MRNLLLILALCCAGPAWSEDIVDVLRRSQDLRLIAMEAAAPDSPQAEIVRASFDTLLRAQPAGTPVDLYVVRGPVVAETLHGHILAVNESLADWSEGARLFILAHELGHARLGHWLQMALLYQKWVPGEVTREHTDAINAPLQREASSLAHRQEYEADAFAASALRAMGRCGAPDAGSADNAAAAMACQDAMLAVFQRQGAWRDTPTHPGAGKRLAALRTHGLLDPVTPWRNACVDAGCAARRP